MNTCLICLKASVQFGFVYFTWLSTDATTFVFSHCNTGSISYLIVGICLPFFKHTSVYCLPNQDGNTLTRMSELQVVERSQFHRDAFEDHSESEIDSRKQKECNSS